MVLHFQINQSVLCLGLGLHDSVKNEMVIQVEYQTVKCPYNIEHMMALNMALQNWLKEFLPETVCHPVKGSPLH